MKSVRIPEAKQMDGRAEMKSENDASEAGAGLDLPIPQPFPVQHVAGKLDAENSVGKCVS